LFGRSAQRLQFHRHPNYLGRNKPVPLRNVRKILSRQIPRFVASAVRHSPFIKCPNTKTEQIKVMQTLFDDHHTDTSETTRTTLDRLAEEEQRPKDVFLAARVVLLVAAGISAFILPWPVTAFLVLAWILVMVWPHK